MCLTVNLELRFYFQYRTSFDYIDVRYIPIWFACRRPWKHSTGRVKLNQWRATQCEQLILVAKKNERPLTQILSFSMATQSSKINLLLWLVHTSQKQASVSQNVNKHEIYKMYRGVMRTRYTSWFLREGVIWLLWSEFGLVRGGVKWLSDHQECGGGFTFQRGRNMDILRSYLGGLVSL